MSVLRRTLGYSLLLWVENHHKLHFYYYSECALLDGKMYCTYKQNAPLLKFPVEKNTLNS